MKLLTAAVLLFLSANSYAQNIPNLSCIINHKDNVTKMMWFPPAKAHLSDNSLEYLNVQIVEKSEAGKVEITIVEAADDAAWDKLNELAKGNEMSAEMRSSLIALGRTRVTHAYVGLYAGILHYEFRLGADPNLYAISCTQNAASFPKE